MAANWTLFEEKKFIVSSGNDKPQVNCLFNRVVPEISPVQFFLC